MPHFARKIPKVHRLPIGNEEGFAVNTLDVQGDGGQDFVGMEQSENREDVTVGDVFDIGEVEQVCVITDLELGLSLAARSDHLGKQLNITLAEDACRTDGAGEEVFGIAVGLEYGSLGICLGMSVSNKRVSGQSDYLLTLVVV